MKTALPRQQLLYSLALIAVALSVTAARADMVMLPTTYDKLEPSMQNMMPTTVVGGLTFSNFTAMTGGGADASNVMVFAVDSSTEPGLTFSLNMESVPTNMGAPAKTVTFGYKVTSSVGFTDAILSATGVDNRDQAANGGVPTITKTITYTDASGMMKTLTLTSTSDANTVNNDRLTQDQGSISGMPTMLMVTETATISASGAMRRATTRINSVTDQFSTVPEPAALIQASIGVLLSLGYVWRCRRALR